MDYKSLASNISVAFLSQGISLILSLATSVLVPKVLGVSEYGYWQLFLFYGSYTAFFHFGLNDGVYLLNGGKDRSSLDASSAASQFLMGGFVQLIFATVLCLIALFGPFEYQRQFVLVSCGAFLLVYNLSSYLGYLFQALNETKLFSMSIMVDRLTFLVPLAVLLLFRWNAFEPYVISYIAARCVCMIYCLWKARDILRAPKLSAHNTLHDCFESVKVGIKLMLANIASMLILGIARFAIDAVWGIDTFGELSLSLSIANFFLMFISQVSMVLFPALRRVEKEELTDFFQSVRKGLGLLLPAAYLFYIPIKVLLALWLPQYAGSLSLFALLLPICVFDGKMDMVGTTFLKVLRGETSLLVINIATVVLSSIITLVGVFAMDSIYVVIGGVVLAIMARSVASEVYVARQLECADARPAIGEIAVTLVFVCVSCFFGDLLSFILTLAAYAAFLLVNHKAATNLLGSFRAVLKG